MKTKLFAIVIIVLLATMSYGQEKEKDSLPNITQTERIIDKYSGEIKEGFNNIVEGVTPYAKEGFQIAVKLQIAKGIVYLLPLLFFIIFLIMFNNEYNRITSILGSDDIPDFMNKHYPVLSEYNASIKVVLSMIATIVMFITALCTTYSAITYLVAPEWFAIKEIIELVK